jgi:hypothetical protein
MKRPSLTCCDAARITRAVTLEAEGQGQPDFAERCRLDPPIWRLRLDSREFGESLTTAERQTRFEAGQTPVRFCPFCGAPAPALRLRKRPPAKVAICIDGGYHCSTCGKDRGCRCAPPELLWEPVP